jgi:hypothetical protein
VAGFNATYPTFLYGDVVVKLFGYFRSWRAGLSRERQLSVAADLGRQVRRVHALRPSGVATEEDWPALNAAAAAEHSSLPPHLIAQVDDYLARLGTFDCVFVHGDLCANHVYVENGRLAGIIDWGDAMVTDRHSRRACDRTLCRLARVLALLAYAGGFRPPAKKEMLYPSSQATPSLERTALRRATAWLRR